MAEKRRKKQEQGRPVQAAAIGAALAVTEAVGKAIGIHGEVEDEQGKPEQSHATGPDAGPDG